MTDIAPSFPPTFLVPIGHDVGPYRPDPSADQYRFRVRVGARIVESDQLGFAIWLLAHDTERGLPNRTSVLDAAANLGLSRADTAVTLETLLADGLLAQVEPGTLREFAESHQLMPLMVGLGPDRTDPEARVAGLLDIPVVQMTAAMYDLWVWSHLRPNLWLACVDAAAAELDAGATEPDRVEPEQVLFGLLSAVHPLLASRAACLDARHTQENERTAAA